MKNNGCVKEENNDAALTNTKQKFIDNNLNKGQGDLFYLNTGGRTFESRFWQWTSHCEGCMFSIPERRERFEEFRRFLDEGDGTSSPLGYFPTLFQYEDKPLTLPS
ncbi:hypothetical protein ACHAXS_005590 [Conticribra weissflogii]